VETGRQGSRKRLLALLELPRLVPEPTPDAQFSNRKPSWGSRSDRQNLSQL
jgi:hypothetical protein